MSLHYLVKLEMFITHGATTALSDKEIPEFIPSQLWPPNWPDLNPVDYSMLGILQKKVYKTCITNLDELKQRLRMYHVVIAAAIRQWCCR